MTNQQIQRNLKLAEALESGKYEQCTGRLRDGDKFCCLGVATELYRKATKNLRWGGDVPMSISGFNFIDKVPPLCVTQYYGWPDRNPAIRIEGRNRLAAEANDAGKTFHDIAKGFRKLAQSAKRANRKAAKAKAHK